MRETLNNLKKILLKFSLIKTLLSLFIIYFYRPIILIPFLIINLIFTPFFLIFNFRIFFNKHLFIIWHPSFGHQVMATDYLRRVLDPNKISVIEILNKFNNPYLRECYTDTNCDFYTFPFKRLTLNLFFGRVSYSVLRFYVNLLIALQSFLNIFIFPHQILTLHEPNSINDIFTIAKNSMRISSDNKSELVNYDDITGYANVLKNTKANNLKLNNHFKNIVVNELKKNIINFDQKKLFVLSFRKKGLHSNFSSDYLRNSDNQKNYIKLIEHILSLSTSNIIILTGEYNKDFNNIDRCYYQENFKVNMQLLNVFLLSSCDYYIGQHSGSLVLAEASGRETMILENFYHSLSTHRESTYICNKKLSKNGHILKDVEIYENNVDLALGLDLSKYRIEPLTSDQMISAFNTFYTKDENKTLNFEIFKDNRMKITHVRNKVIIV